MKRYPNGVAAQPFYQHRAQDVPPGVRVETVRVAETRQQIVGGDLTTLLYMTQLAAISQDPWFSRVQSIESADHVALDLDPSEGVKFSRVLDVARAIRDELDALGAAGVPKTSGADGLAHLYPAAARHAVRGGPALLPDHRDGRRTEAPEDCDRRAKRRARAAARVYVDYLQNILGQDAGDAYSARASDYAGVSTPLTWQEVDAGVERQDFTIQTAPARFKEVGDLWAALRKGKGVDLSKVFRYAERVGTATPKRKAKGR